MGPPTPRLIALGALALLLGAGLAATAPFDEGVEPASGGPAQPSAADGAGDRSRGEMTVRSAEETREGVQAEAQPFYASRVVTLEGNLTLAELSTVLAAESGSVDLAAGDDDRWRMVANMTGYGATPEEARSAREAMSLDWDAGDPGEGHLEARIHHEGDSSGGQTGRYASHLEVRVPVDVELSARANATDGDVDVDGVQARGLAASAVRGAVNVDAGGSEDVRLAASDGPITARLDPAANGSIAARTTNDQLDLTVPETGDHGYDVEASASDGEVEIGLEDGETERSNDGSEATFRTHGFAERPIRTAVDLAAENGEVTVGPAN
jgi:hypothetical protein